LLGEGEGASEEIEDNVFKTPTDRGLSLPVEVYLGHVLDERDCSLGVSTQSDGGPLLLNERRLLTLDYEDEEDGAELKGQEGDDIPVDALLLASVVHEDLGELEGGEGEGVQSEENIVRLDRPRLPYLLVNHALQVVDGVEVKASRVEHSEFDRKACHALGDVVLD